MAVESAIVRKATTSSVFSCSKSKGYRANSQIRVSHYVDDKDRVYKQLGLFSLKKKIEDSVRRAEVLASTELVIEEARRYKQEELIRDCNLWDNPAKSSEIFAKLADSTKMVDYLKDLAFKAEEAKLIAQLAEKDAINYGLFKRAYKASLDANKTMDTYEMSKLLKGPYDKDGACLIIEAGSEGYSEVWANQLLNMYIKWAKRQGNKGRVIEKLSSLNGGIKSATIEFEFQFAYGFLSGERGTHSIIRSSKNGSSDQESCSASVDIVPLFLDKTSDLQINDEDLIITSPSVLEEEQSKSKSAISIHHIPTCIKVQSAGLSERSHFANIMKAQNRLKAKLMVISWEQGVSCISDIKREAIVDVWQQRTREYMFEPYKLVQDFKTGFRLTDLNSVLDGNLELLIGAHVNSRQLSDIMI